MFHLWCIESINWKYTHYTVPSVLYLVYCILNICSLYCSICAVLSLCIYWIYIYYTVPSVLYSVYILNIYLLYCSICAVLSLYTEYMLTILFHLCVSSLHIENMLTILAHLWCIQLIYWIYLLYCSICDVLSLWTENILTILFHRCCI